MNHMNSKTVLGLGAAAVAAIAIAAGISLSRTPQSEGSQAEGPVLPLLAEHVNDVKRISLTSGGQKRIATLEKGDNGWSLAEKNGYRADTGKVREWLLKLSQARLVEQKTANEQRYADIGVADITAADAKGVLVALEGLPQPAQLIVGNVNPRGDSTYVRRAGEKQSWLAKGNLIPDRTAANWLDKTVTDIAATRVRELVLEKPGAKPLRVFKAQPSDTGYALADLPKGRQLSSEFAANTLATVLAGLNFDDVFAAADAAAPADAKLHRARFTTFDGIVVQIDSWNQDGKAYARLSAQRDAAIGDAAIAAAQAKAKADWEAAQAAAAAPTEASAAGAKPEPPLAVSDAAKDKAEQVARAEVEVAKLQQRFDGWVFVLPPHKFASLDSSLESLLKPLATDKPATK